jgi:hypothetical protein
MLRVVFLIFDWLGVSKISYSIARENTPRNALSLRSRVDGFMPAFNSALFYFSSSNPSIASSVLSSRDGNACSIIWI